MEDKKIADNIFKGLVLLMLGLTLWVGANGILTIFDFLDRMAPVSFFGPQQVLQVSRVLGIAVMILGPIYYWVVVPMRNWLSKKT